MKSHVFGGMLLVTGCCVGAGMLALPITTGLSGFFPSLSMMLCAWAFMTLTGLLLIEVNHHFPHRSNLLTMVKHTLGMKGEWIAWVSYLLLMYSLLVAYIAISGAPYLMTLICAAVVYFDTRAVDLFNRLLMLGLIATFTGLLALGLPDINFELLSHTSSGYLLQSLPILVVSFGFHNLVPSLLAYSKNNLKETRLIILGGSLITLCIYLLWNLVVLGNVTPDAILAAFENGEDATLPLRAIITSPYLGTFAKAFSFFAIITSFIAISLSLSHFLHDGLKLNKPMLTLLVFAPPLIFALFNPQIFFKTLGLAGGLFAMILFGILPALMALKLKLRNPALLISTILFALFIMGCEFVL